MIIKQSYIELIEKNNGVLHGLWIDPFFIVIAKNYFQLLDGVEYDVATISNASYIKNLLEENRLKQEAEIILFTEKPIEYVQKAIEKVAKAGSIYENW